MITTKTKIYIEFAFLSVFSFLSGNGLRTILTGETELYFKVLIGILHLCMIISAINLVRYILKWRKERELFHE